MREKIFKIVKIVSALGLLVFFLVLLNNEVQQSDNTEENDTQDQKLNVAMVNEDKGITIDGNEYTLGLNYIKKIEKDTSHNWYVVSRGVAESGLKNGNYQLMVVIPSNFSEKLLEMNTTSPEQIQVNYKVNSNGNTDVENESIKVGDKIVNDLNQQLVDMYVSSILDNLYTAQKNIQKVATNQEQTVVSYEDNVFQQVADLLNYLPGLVTRSDSASQSNEGLTETLINNSESFLSYIVSQEEYHTTLEELVAQRAEGLLTYENFVEKLLSMDKALLSAETNALYEKLVGTNALMQTDFKNQAYEDSFVAQMSLLDTQLLDNQANILNQIDALNLKIAGILERYNDELFGYFNIDSSTVDENTTITLGQILKSRDPDNYSKIESTLSAIATNNESNLERIRTLLSKLPYIEDYSDYKDQFSKLGDTTLQLEIQELLGQTGGIIELLNSEKLSEDFQKIIQDTTYLDKLDNAVVNLEDNKLIALDSVKEIKIIDIEGITEGLLTLNTLADITITDILVDGDSKLSFPSLPVLLDVENPSSITISYKLNDVPDIEGTAPEISLTLFQKENSTTVTEPITPPVLETEQEETTAEETTAEETTGEEATGDSEAEEPKTNAITIIKQPKLNWTCLVPIDVSSFQTTEYLKSSREYSEVVGEIKGLYTQSLSELTYYSKNIVYDFDLDTLLEMDFRDYFKDILTSCFSRELSEHLTTLEGLKTESDGILSQMSVLNERMILVQENVSALQEDVNSQLSLLGEWRNQIGELITSESGVSSYNSQTDAEISSNKDTMVSLLQTSQLLKEYSDDEVVESESIKTIFNAFSEEVASTLENGEELSLNTDQLMLDFEEELSKNNDFVSSFTKVLSNAHQDGVSNEALLSFIANPVTGSVEATIQSAEVYKPFTWILIIFSISLFTGYVFATQEIVEKVKSAFQKDRIWIADNIVNTILVVICSIIIGIVLGIVSDIALEITQEDQLLWVFVIILLTTAFTLMSHLLIKQFKVSGLGVGIFLLISYVFLTNAVGTTTVLNSFSQNMKDINPLAGGETLLMTFFSTSSIGFGKIFMIVMIIFVLILLNLLIWRPGTKAREV